jgi:hypothetical protein
MIRFLSMNAATFYRYIAIAMLAWSTSAWQASAQTAPRTVHVFVALADNAHQGIVPVPPKLGNGLDPQHNLYWGAAGGVKTFFARSAEWRLVAQLQKPKPGVLERCIFRRRTTNVYIVADAYQGDRIRQALTDFLDAAAGVNAEQVTARFGTHEATIPAGGSAQLVAYVGHDALMDFSLSRLPQPANSNRRDAIVLACASKSYFAEALRSTGAHPLLWTTGLMAPEAYTLKEALGGWILGERDQQVRERAAMAYDHYQKCGIKAARRLFATGW